MPHPELPVGLVAERRTPSFDTGSVPAALTRLHHTAVWAELRVEAGTVRFVEPESPTGRDVIIRAGGRLVIVPEVKHRTELSPDALFYVQFFVRSRRLSS
jgi:tellurite resistance-related uncharacterized protein